MKQGVTGFILLAVFAVLVGAGVMLMQGARDNRAAPSVAPAAGDHDHGAGHTTHHGAESATVTPIGGDFTLTDHHGATVTQADYPGYKLVFFGFTRCPDICPPGLMKMSQAMDALGPDAAQVQPLFITVDPEYDTPAVMKDFVGVYHDRMVGLTGTPEEIKTVLEDFRVYAAKAPADNTHEEHHGAHHGAHGSTEGSGPYTINHSGYTYLLGPDGYMVTVFASDDDPAAMAAEILAILEQS